MPRFEPFAGLRYDLDQVALADVTAPPYDVIDDDDRAVLAARHRFNAVHIDLPVATDGTDRYQVACRLLGEWQEAGVLVADPVPAFYGYRMAYTDDHGRRRRTTGVIGALELSPPGESGVLPHEHTTPKAHSDRLDMLRACRANLSAVWGLSLTAGLTALCEPPGAGGSGDPLVAGWTDDDGVEHALWVLTDPERLAAITAAVAASPVVIADGHHRYATSLVYRDERRQAEGRHAGRVGAAGATLTYVVELAEEELTVRPIHRLLGGLPDGFDLVGALAAYFDAGPSGELAAGDVLARMSDGGALAAVAADGTYRLLRPRPEALRGIDDLDSSRLAVALATLPEHTVSYQHGVGHVARRVADGRAQHGVLLRPATVAQIAANAHEGRRMPPKTTFFHPKPKTGLVFRLLA
ncbi:DUF1015 domain-containing protein [soil metagenome]